jgi:hypothetical protein
MWVSPPDSFIHNATSDYSNTIGVHSNEWSILLGYYITYTKRFMSPGGLSSHIYDVGEPSRLLISNATLERPNTIGVHPNEWSTLRGYYITFTKRSISSDGLSSHIYDVGEPS